jgi:hypothetical protein
MNEFDALVAQFLNTEKTARIRPRWRTARHPDYAEAKMAVATPRLRTHIGLVVMTAHRVRLPPKYSFSLLFRGQRVLALDVNPGRAHRNLLLPRSVAGTHWQRWPMMDAELDNRDQTFAAWFAIS